MTQKTLSSLILIVFVSLISFRSFSTVHTTKTALQTEVTNNLSSGASDENLPLDRMPFFPPSESNEPHGKALSVHMDELPHIHKFHKERVKKVKKHHSKLWFISQFILVLCHISILLIAFMHVTH